MITDAPASRPPKLFVRWIPEMIEKAIPALLVLGAVGVNKVLPNEVVRKKLTALMYHLGVVMTLGMSKHPKVGPMWNKTVEPVVVDFVDNFAFAVREGLVKGLRSDNALPPAAPQTKDSASQTDPVPIPEIKPAPTPAPPITEPAWWRAKTD